MDGVVGMLELDASKDATLAGQDQYVDSEVQAKVVRKYEEVVCSEKADDKF